MKLLTKIKHLRGFLVCGCVIASSVAWSIPARAGTPSTLAGTYSYTATSAIYSKINSYSSHSKTPYHLIIQGTAAQTRSVRDKYTKKYMPCADWELATGTLSNGKQYIMFVPAGIKSNKLTTSSIGSAIKKQTSKAIGNASSDSQKVDKIITYIRNKFSYSTATSYSKNAATLVSFWNTKKGSCWQYSKLFRAMCNYAGMKCQIIYGRINNKTLHAWNRVKINDSWKYVDVTFCDSSNSNTSYGPSSGLWSDHKIDSNVQRGFVSPYAAG